MEKEKKKKVIWLNAIVAKANDILYKFASLHPIAKFPSTVKLPITFFLETDVPQGKTLRNKVRMMDEMIIGVPETLHFF